MRPVRSFRSATLALAGGACAPTSDSASEVPAQAPAAAPDALELRAGIKTLELEIAAPWSGSGRRC